MQVTGFKITEAIEQWKLRVDALNAEFEDSLHAFEGEQKRKPLHVATDLAMAERAVAALQTVQARFNLAVTVTIQGEELTLMEAIKRKGGIDRQKKLWKQQVGTSGTYHEMVRTTDQIHARRTVTPAEVVANLAQVAKMERAVQAAIAAANTTVLDLEGVVPALFE